MMDGNKKLFDDAPILQTLENEHFLPASKEGEENDRISAADFIAQIISNIEFPDGLTESDVLALLNQRINLLEPNQAIDNLSDGYYWQPQSANRFALIQAGRAAGGQFRRQFRFSENGLETRHRALDSSMWTEWNKAGEKPNKTLELFVTNHATMHSHRVPYMRLGQQYFVFVKQGDNFISRPEVKFEVAQGFASISTFGTITPHIIGFTTIRAYWTDGGVEHWGEMIIFIDNEQTDTAGASAELPKIELRVLNQSLQYRIVGENTLSNFSALNPRLVLFRRVRQNKDTSSKRKDFPAKVQYVIPRTQATGIPNVVHIGAVRFIDSGTPNKEGWINLSFAHNGTAVTAQSILNLFSITTSTGTKYRRRSRSSVTIGNTAGANYFAQYYGIGFACDNPANSEAMNTRGQNLLYHHIAKFKAGVYREPVNNGTISFFQNRNKLIFPAFVRTFFKGNFEVKSGLGVQNMALAVSST